MIEARANIAHHRTIGRRLVIAASIVAVASAVAVRIATKRTDHRARLVAAAGRLPDRAIEGRLEGGFAHRPFAPVDRSGDTVDPAKWPLYEAAADSSALSTPDAVQTRAVAELLVGRASRAVDVLSTAAKNATRKSDLPDAVHACEDHALLTDLCAAELETYRRGGDPRALLMAVESSTEAVMRKPTPEALWNRALAIERLGMRDEAVAAWNAYLHAEPDREWAAEGRRRLEGWPRREHRDLDGSMRAFEQRVMAAAQAPAGEAPVLLDATRAGDLSSDAFAADVASAVIAGLRDANRESAVRQGLLAYARGLRAADAEDIEAAASAFGEADRQLTAAHNPFALAAAYQRMRAVCNQGIDECDADIESLRARLSEPGVRYESLTAKVALARGRRLLSHQRSFEALQEYEEALSVFERMHDATNAAWAHSLVADVLVGSGETDSALPHHLRALSSDAEGVHRRQELEEASLLLIRLDALDTASVVLDALRRMPGSAVARAAESALQASLALRRGRQDAARMNVARAEALLRGVPESATAWIRPYLEVVNVAMLRDGENALAARRFDDRAAKGDLLWQSEIAYQRGLLHQKQGWLREAEADFHVAIDLIERRAPSLREMVMGAGLLGGGDSSPFDALIALLLDQGRHAEALVVAERSNALQVSELYGKPEGLANPYSRVDASASQAGGALPGTLIVEYAALPHELVTFAMRGAAVTVRRQAIERRQLTNEIHAFAACVRDGCKDDALVGRVSRLLVEESVDAASGDEPVVFIAPADWDVVPFVALTDRAGRPLLDRHAVAVAGSIEELRAALATDAARAQATSALFVAASVPGPPLAALPAAEEETAGASLYCHRMVLTGRNATRTNFLANARNAAVIDFAGHAVVDRRQPLRSALVFSRAEDGAGDLLYVHDVTTQLFARTRLAVLAACETGIAPRPAMSIAAALRARGTPSVVYSLWRVDDATTAAFSIAFHRRVAGGQTRVDAMTEALRELRRSARRDQWAAFQLTGALGSITKGDKVCN